MKALLMLALSVLCVLPARAQTNCASVNWTNNVWTTNGSPRLRIVNYQDNVTLQPICFIPFFDCDVGAGDIWDGTFSAVVTNYQAVRYYAQFNFGTIAGRKLSQAMIFWDPLNSKWWLQVFYTGSGSLGPFENIIWEGQRSGTNPIGAYACTASADGVLTHPSSLSVECYIPRYPSCYVDLSIHPSPFVGFTNMSTNLDGALFCTGLVDPHQYNADGLEIYTDLSTSNSAMILRIHDGDRLRIKWPECCLTTWGIAAQGPLFWDSGTNAPVAVKRVTLCVPNFRGTMPIDQITETNASNGGPGTLLAQPLGAITLPPMPGEAYPVGFNGAEWKAHIRCDFCGTGSGTCTAYFELLTVIPCDNPTWVWNAMADWANAWSDVINSSTNLLMKGNTYTRVLYTNGFFYQWYGGPPSP